MAAAAVSLAPLSLTRAFRWPDAGWQLGRVRSRSLRAPFTQVMGYRHATAAFAGEVVSLLDGSHCVLLVPAGPPPAARVCQ